jgi:hypothetical protein
MERVTVVCLLTLSLSLLNAPVVNAFGTKTLLNSLAPTEIEDFDEIPFLDALLRTNEFSQNAEAVANAVTGPVPQAIGLSNLAEGFEDVGALAPAWEFVNNSSQPSATSIWRQGDNTVGNFDAQAGSRNSFAQVDATSTTAEGGATISNWLITPELDFSLGGIFSFYARTLGGNSRAEFIEVLQSNAGARANVGSAAADVGDFTTTVGTVGSLEDPFITATPFPAQFQRFDFKIAPTGGSGRLAFRYFATNGGFGGNASQAQYATIDTVSYNAAVPEPVSSSLAGFAVLGLASYFKTKRRRTIA